jgi:maltose-binding protein MalE
MRRVWSAAYAAVGVMLVVCLVACGDTPSDALVISGASTVSPRPTIPDTLAAARNSANSLVAGQGVQPTPTGTQAVNRPKIRVWWPDELYPEADSLAEDVLLRQFDSFRTTYSSYDLEVRRKRSTGLGGILPTLRTARPVAPNAVPDVTLLRYADLVTAATEGLIVPIDGVVPSDLHEGNLLEGARALGESGGVLYGVPYVLNFTHTVYRLAVYETPPLTFDDILAVESGYRFSSTPLGAGAVNNTVLAQYLAAGGRLVDENGVATLDPDPLLDVLEYYASAVAADIFSPSMLENTDPTSQWNAFVSADLNLVGVDSMTYLRHKDSVSNVGLATVPTLEGVPITLVDGWAWVVTTQDAGRQDQARAFLSWMMRVSQQSLLTEALGVVPSQQRALRLWDDESYAQFAQDLVPHGRVLPTAYRTGRAAQALQESFIAVINGTPAAEAAQIAISHLAD